jgi:type I restriction enzyme S subunit
MAKQLYDYWFVQFDFPDENGRPYKSSGGKMVWNEKLKREIPEGWDVSTLDKLGSFKNGINYSKEDNGNKLFKIVNVRNISSSTYFIDNSDLDEINLISKSAESYLIKEQDILIARSGTPGATRLIANCESNIVYCGFIICYSVYDMRNKNFLFFLLKQLEAVTKIKSNGSILSNVSQDVLKGIILAIPPRDVIDVFNFTIQRVLDKIISEQTETIYLQKQRDELLPLLMNGQVSVTQPAVNCDLAHYYAVMSLNFLLSTLSFMKNIAIETFINFKVFTHLRRLYT